MDAPAEDGPLWRAIIGSFERRITTLRMGLKAMKHGLEAALDALHKDSAANEAIDAALSELSVTSSTSKSNVLGGLYERALRESRIQRGRRIREEVRTHDDLMRRLKDSYERLKALEGRKKAFEAASKAYYDDVSKYLSRNEAEPTKSSALDKTHAARTVAFQQARVDYFSFLEGLVSCEENAVASWLQTWAGVGDDQSLEVPSAVGAVPLSAIDSKEREAAGAESASEDGWSASGSGFSQVGGIVPTSPRTRRTSMPAFVSEMEGTRGRIKGFLSRTGITAPSPAGQSTPATPSKADEPPQLLPSPRLSAPPQTKKQQQANLRKKEGFLWATSKPVGHTAVGDGGGHWHKYWTVLSEGQLISYRDWKTALAILNEPLNLRYATARISRNTDRRFCLEVITPASRWIYQALTEEDAAEWVAAINRSIESLINGTSSVRYFDPGRLTGTSTPYSLNDFGSTTSLARHASEAPTLPTSPSGGLSHLSNRLPAWMGPPLSRRASLGGLGGRRGKKVPREDKSDTAAPAPPTGAIPTLSASRLATLSESEASAASSVSSRSTSRVVSAGSSTPTDSLPPSSSSHLPSSTPTGSEPDSLCEHDRRITELVTNMAGPFVSEDDKLAAKIMNAQRIHDLSVEEGNNVCADCGEEDPRWASWSLGVFVCIRCSGIHRSLGTHVSKVRSVELDDWSNEQISAMELVGNRRAKEFFEARRPSSDPLPTDTTIITFIQTKYVARTWVPLDSSPSLLPEAPTKASSNWMLKAVGL